MRSVEVQDCDTCGKLTPIQTLQTRTVEVEVPEGISVTGEHGDARIHRILTVCPDCTHSDRWPDLEKKAQEEMLAKLREASS